MNMTVHHRKVSFLTTPRLGKQNCKQRWQSVVAGESMQEQKRITVDEEKTFKFTPHRSPLRLLSLSSYRPHHPHCHCPRPCSRPFPLGPRHPRHRQPQHFLPQLFGSLLQVHLHLLLSPPLVPSA